MSKTTLLLPASTIHQGITAERLLTLTAAITIIITIIVVVIFRNLILLMSILTKCQDLTHLGPYAVNLVIPPPDATKHLTRFRTPTGIKRRYHRKTKWQLNHTQLNLITTTHFAPIRRPWSTTNYLRPRRKPK